MEKDKKYKLVLSPYITTLIAEGFLVIGTLLGVWIGYKFSKSLIVLTSRQQAAVIYYSYFLSKKDRDRFSTAWREYCYHPDDKIDKSHEMKKLAQSRIEKILEFAKPI